MVAFLFSDLNCVFTVALGIVLALSIAESIGFIFGLDLLHLKRDSSPLSHAKKPPHPSWTLRLIVLLSIFAFVGYLITYLFSTFIPQVAHAGLTVMLSLIVSLGMFLLLPALSMINKVSSQAFDNNSVP
ncbi:hypothetical protein DRW07_08470 [Alteromonas sediminis]|uniref:Uncharacterized protein n=1 Tax=Alteromonas sediminis TaxID=2259342 RepID=A0A3N5ZCC8_9ALTE|nr:hypothetical protein [Alteromonas sediminis]RPJ67538.1 hypothetical protein DRW07_08470 [Alteromonas sediminis]